MASLFALAPVDRDAPVAAATTLTRYSGASADQAAPSCWAIKRSFASSRDGAYWLLTPTMVRPKVVYCDMTTDGGGWELIARGRDGWSFSWFGQGTSDQVATTPTGARAFAPATLSSTMVDGLLDGRAASTLYDGVRVKRALDSGGTTWQEARLYLAFMQRWSWEWDFGQPLTKVRFGSRTGTVGPKPTHFEGSTYDARLNNSTDLIHTGVLAGHYNRKGFAYGSSVHGLARDSSYLWTATDGGSYALPFTQVFIRPRFGDADMRFPAIPPSGLPAQPQPKLPGNVPQRFDWGVSTVTKPPSDPDPQGDSFVYAFAQIGNTMFVGGKFARVEHHSTNTYADQPWLAAFDVTTGEWVRTFRPALDGAVLDLAATPDGKLIVAGNFTSINGAANSSGLAEIDPATGDVVTAWRAALKGARFGLQRPFARAIAIADDKLYVAGAFTKVEGAGTSVDTGGVARVALADGTPDTSWHPFTNSTVWDVHPSIDGSRVYIAGFFTTVGSTAGNAVTAESVAALDPQTGMPVGGNWPVFNPQRPTQHGQFAVTETPDLVAHGGNEWWLAAYDKTSLAVRRTAMIHPFGDIQVLLSANGFLFGGCHCLGESYADFPAQYTRVDSLGWLGAWNPVTMDRVNAFAPQWRMAKSNEGIWAAELDSFDCLWAGGDIVGGAGTEWLSGFARLCPGDTTAPSRPGTPFVSSGRIWWSNAWDTQSALSYEVMRNNRVIAMTKLNRIDNKFGKGTYVIRGIDAAGNRSATSPPLTIR